MTRYFSALLLLAVFGLGLLLGPHPCVAERADPGSGSEEASCHETEPTPTGPQLSDDSTQQDEGDCCGTLCQHACHVTAIAAPELVAFAISPASEARMESAGSGLLLFAHPIDHIPLA